MNCRFDGEKLHHVFADLGFSPPSNSYLNLSDLNEPEIHYPLKLWVSERTFLVQVDEFKKASDIFSNDYAYFSSYSSSWLDHCKNYAEYISEKLKLNSNSMIIEIASNDGYLLQYFKEKDIPVLGIEPTSNTAEAALKKGIDTRIEFFGEKLARNLFSDGISADLLIGNNVLAHVPDINDFVKGLKIILKPDGLITMEFPHLMELILNNQFDTIYHEHFSYLSLYTVKLIFEKHGLAIVDAEQIPTHGGSLRIYARHAGSNISNRVTNIIEKERIEGLFKINTYLDFQTKIQKVKFDFLNFLLEAQKQGKSIVAYGAAAKGNTLLNYCGIRSDLIKFVCDLSPHKQNKYMPGSHIPIRGPEAIQIEKPDYILILPWNIKEEIMNQLSFVKDWDCHFVSAIPELKIS